jgi:hypothetical protein
MEYYYYYNRNKRKKQIKKQMNCETTQQTFTEEALKKIEPLINADFKFAWTMKYIPHWYTLRSTWADDTQYVAALEAIDEYGEKVKWGKKTYTYLYVGEYKYWAMHLGDYNVSKVINRAKIKKDGD